MHALAHLVRSSLGVTTEKHAGFQDRAAADSGNPAAGRNRRVGCLTEPRFSAAVIKVEYRKAHAVIFKYEVYPDDAGWRWHILDGGDAIVAFGTANTEINAKCAAIVGLLGLSDDKRRSKLSQRA